MIVTKWDEGFWGAGWVDFKGVKYLRGGPDCAGIFYPGLKPGATLKPVSVFQLSR